MKCRAWTFISLPCINVCRHGWKFSLLLFSDYTSQEKQSTGLYHSLCLNDSWKFRSHLGSTDMEEGKKTHGGKQSANYHHLTLLLSILFPLVWGGIPFPCLPPLTLRGVIRKWSVEEHCVASHYSDFLPVGGKTLAILWALLI